MYDAVIIGAGPAGYTCAIRIAQLGGKVALIEKDLVGGICINWGCTPSKAMISSAKVARTVLNSEEYGVLRKDVKIDFNKVAERRDQVVSRSRKEIENLLTHWGVDLIQGAARIIDNKTVEVNGDKFVGDNVVIATGSEALIPGFLQKQDPSIINSNELVKMHELPKELTIVGGGIIGMEIATIFSNLGTKVRIVELLDRCLAVFDPEISQTLTAEMQRIGVEILTGHKVMEISQGTMKVEKAVTGEQFTFPSPLNLIAIGRKANVNEDEMKRLGLAYDRAGVIVNSYLQTSRDGIYAIGDATGRSILAHVAIQQAIVAAENIMGRGKMIDYKVIPAVVYSFPEVASVGEIPQMEYNDSNGMFRQKEYLRIVKYPFSANLRANIEGHNTGFVKVWYNERTSRIEAVQMVGDMAGEVIQGFANIMALDLDIAKVADTIHAHPTYNEIVRNTMELILGRAIEYY